MRTETPCRILHLGLGSFHRAHQAACLQRLHDMGERDWSIAGGNIRAGMEDVATALHEQGGAFTLESVSPDGVRRHQRIESIRHVVPLQGGLAALAACASDPATRIISFTVTEAGYYFDAAGGLDFSHPDLARDAQDALEGSGGHSLYGALTLLLRARRQSGAGKVTLLCCDNLRANGARSREGLLRFLQHVGDGGLAAWIGESTTSPDCMVDRITPRPTAELRERVRLATGWNDRAPVMAEAFQQWVIEDRFCNGRPAWERAGAEMVSR